MNHNTEQNIILTGFMATGKSTIGRLIAQTLGLNYVDTDEHIVTKKGISIPEIFKRFGEKAFRDMETDAAMELATQDGLVISTGGRMMLDPVNVNLLTKTGRVFCLTAPPDEILRRLQQDKINTRPLLDVSDPKEKIIELLEERKKGYQQFQKISTCGKEPSEVAQEIIAFIEA